MFNNVALDVAIGLVFIFLLYSLLATTFQELVAQALALRGRMLVKGIRTMLEDRHEHYHFFSNITLLRRFLKSTFKSIWHFGCPFPNNTLAKKFYKHPTIKYLSESSWNSKPSYIGPENFSDTMIRILRTKSYDGTKDQMLMIEDTLKKWKVEREKRKQDLQIAAYLCSEIYANIEKWPDSFGDKIKKQAKERTQQSAIEDNPAQQSADPLNEIKDKIKDILTPPRPPRPKGLWKRGKVALKNVTQWVKDLSNKKKEHSAEKIDAILNLLRAQEFDTTIPSDYTYNTYVAKRKKKMEAALTISVMLDDQVLIIGPETLEQLLQLSYDAQKDIFRFKAQLEQWFNHTMDRVTGWYKKQNQTMLIVTGLFIAYLFNVDSIAIYKVLAKDKKAREAMVQMAIHDKDKIQKVIARNERTGKDSSYVTQKDTSKYYDTLYKELAKDADEVNNILGLGKPYKEDSAVRYKLIKNKRDSLYSVLYALYKKQGVDIRRKICWCIPWSDKRNAVLKPVNAKYVSLNRLIAQYHSACRAYNKFDRRLIYCDRQTSQGSTLVGWFITALAISLGAPFWFDLLNKLVQLRGAGKKSDTEDKGNTGNNNTKTLTQKTIG